MSDSLLSQYTSPARLQMLNKKLSVITSVLLIIAIAWMLAKITWLFLPQDETTDIIRAPGNIIVGNSAKRQQQQHFSQLTAASLFGTSAGKPVVQQTKKAPETKLNLTLKGVLATDPMELASAIIAKGKSGKEDIYGIGDKMQGGVTIKEIHPDYVILDRRGQLETLKLQKQSGLQGNFRNHSRTTVPIRRNSANSPAEALQEIRSQILKSPTSFGDYALPVVVRENGKQVGYRLQPQSQGKLLQDLGLQPSDIITQINGVKLDKPQNGISALRKLSTANDLSITVKRNGNFVPINIKLK